MNFNLGALTDWEAIEPGELRSLEVGVAGFRRVDLDLFSDYPVAAYVVRPGEPDTPVAVGEGMLSTSFTAVGDVALVVVGDAAAKIRLRSKVRSQRVPESDEPSYTSIEPRPAGPGDEVRRMMRIMHLNQERRMAALRAEIAALKPQEAVQRLEELVEEQPAPKEPNKEAKQEQKE